VLKKRGLDQYDAEHFEMYPFDTTGFERVNLGMFLQRLTQVTGCIKDSTAPEKSAPYRRASPSILTGSA